MKEKNIVVNKIGKKPKQKAIKNKQTKTKQNHTYQ